MAGRYDINFSGDPQAVKDLVARVLGEQGFATRGTPDGGLTAKRGSTGLTLLLGGLAGKNLQMTFSVEFLGAADGGLIARVSRSVAAGALKGGALGASRTNTVFGETINAIAAAASAAGSYVNAVES